MVRIATADARELVDAYGAAANSLADRGAAIERLARRAGDLLDAATPTRVAFVEVAQRLRADRADLLWRVEFLIATDGLTLPTGAESLADLERRRRGDRADEFTTAELLALLSAAETPGDVVELVEWIAEDGIFTHREKLLGFPQIEPDHRGGLAAALVIAAEHGWRPDDGFEGWMAASMLAHANPNAALTLELASITLTERDRLHDPTRPNPFGLSEADGIFGPAARRLAAEPALARDFVASLLDEHDRTGDTPLNMHGWGERDEIRLDHLADVVIAAGTAGTTQARERFVDRLVRTVNRDGDTNEQVFFAVWATHAELALTEGVATTAPTVGIHSLLPDDWRMKWSRAWEGTISPMALAWIFHEANEIRRPPLGRDEDTYRQSGPGNDAGGTYTTRDKAPWEGVRQHRHVDPAVSGRAIVTHALRDGSADGDIAQDEFAIIDHGIGANGRPTYTINLPGVIDLSSQVPGFDPVHRSVRDMDQVAIHSAPTARIEDNLYAQMVERALWMNDVPLGANLMIVGHSFGADTALDLAADAEFTSRFNVTHVVAAAYDSVPQLASVSPDIDVLVLQNSGDLAIAMEKAHRDTSRGDESVSVNTFAHEVREFDGGIGLDIGHHQRRYIEYLESARNDPEMHRFLRSVGVMGYGEPGTTVAIDVTVDESLLPPT